MKCFANEELKKGQSSIICLWFRATSGRVGFGSRVHFLDHFIVAKNCLG